MIATATYYPPVADVRSYCVDTAGSWVTGLGQSTALIFVW